MENIYLTIGHIFIGVCVTYVGVLILWFIVKLITDKIMSIWITTYAMVDYLANRTKFKKWKNEQNK